MKHVTSIATLLLLCVLSMGIGAAQPTIYVGIGPSVHADAPRLGLNLTTGMCTADAVDCALVNYATRFDIRNRNQAAYTTTIGWRHVLKTVRPAYYGRVDLFSLGTGGAAVSAGAIGFDGAAGGGITYHPKGAPNFGVSIALLGDRSPLNPGWKPAPFLQAGYEFR